MGVLLIDRREEEEVREGFCSGSEWRSTIDRYSGHGSIPGWTPHPGGGAIRCKRSRFRVSGFFVVDECAIRGGSRATELQKHASARERTHRTRRTPHPQSNSRNTEKHV